MKKFKIIICTLSIIALILTSCDPSVESPGSNDTSEVTFLPLITLEGGDVVLDCNANSYSDPGAIASAGGVEIELFTDIRGKYFGGTSVIDGGSDTYLVSYSAFNDDEIPATGFREVLYPECNGDLVTSIAGMYTGLVARNGSSPYPEAGPFIIKDLGNDRYAISDAHGGWYEYGRAIGLAYATPGLILKANNISANDFTAESNVTTNTFGGTNVFKSLEVDPVAKTLTLTVDWTVGSSFFSFETVFTQTDIYYN